MTCDLSVALDTALFCALGTISFLSSTFLISIGRYFRLLDSFSNAVHVFQSLRSRQHLLTFRLSIWILSFGPFLVPRNYGYT